LTLSLGFAIKNFSKNQKPSLWGVSFNRSFTVSCSERKREIRRRRHRLKKLKIFSRKLASATVSEKVVLADKLRSLTPGAEVLIDRWELVKR
jgi:hypothetical protein